MRLSSYLKRILWVISWKFRSIILPDLFKYYLKSRIQRMLNISRTERYGSSDLIFLSIIVRDRRKIRVSRWRNFVLIANRSVAVSGKYRAKFAEIRNTRCVVGIKRRSFSFPPWGTSRQRNVLSESLASPVGRTHQRVDLKLSRIMRNRPLLCPGRLRYVGPGGNDGKIKESPRGLLSF